MQHMYSIAGKRRKKNIFALLITKHTKKDIYFLCESAASHEEDLGTDELVF